jgi:FRG domain
LSWSLAQHYGVMAALLDLTFDPEVAAWFATNLWDGPEKPQPLKGNGVIYRFDFLGLLAGIFVYNRGIKPASGAYIYKAPPDKTFIQDLRQIPPAFTLRPTRQEAAVL